MSRQEFQEEDWPNEPYHDFLVRAIQYQRQLQPFKKHRISWDIIRRCCSANAWEENSILHNDRTTWNNLQLICSQEEKGKSLLYQIDRTKSALGHKLLACWIAYPKPQNEIEKVLDRQKYTKILLEDELLFNALDQNFSEMQASENLVLSFWLNDPLYNGASKKYFHFFSTEINDALNSSSFALACSSLYDHTKRAAYFISASYGCYALAKLGLGYELGSGAYSFLGNAGPMFSCVYDYFVNNLTSSYLTQIFYGAASLASWNMVIETYEWEKDQIELEQYLHEKLKHLSLYMEKMQVVADFAKSMGINALSEILLEFENEEHPIHELLLILRRVSWDSALSCFYYSGDVLKAYKILQEHRGALERALCAAAEIDVYMSIARLYKEHKELPVSYCFVNFVQDAIAPMILNIAVWNPFIDPIKVVANTIKLGTSEMARNIILTGPNEGGKSTFVRGVALELILAQSLGIAPAKEAWITPFNYLATYLNVTDQDGKSLFDAQVDRAKHLFDRIDALEETQFAYVVLDELFNGTNPEIGQLLAYNYAKNLGARSNVIAILPTHFPQLTSLGKAQGFEKYCVTAEISNSGKLRYLYKIVPGIWTHNVAFDIMREAGFSEDFMQEIP